MNFKDEKVDLIGKAYENARAEGVQLRTKKSGASNACGNNTNVNGACDTSYLKVIAPAKVNLYLAVGKRQDNGYHSVENVMHTLLIHDVLYLRCLSSQAYEHETGVSRASIEDGATTSSSYSGLKIHLTCSGCGSVVPPNIPAQDNIVYKAIKALARAINRTEDEVFDIHLEKHIPHQAGLGGGSSDAAAALVGAAKLWGLSAEDPRIEQVAKSLGADVAFFLRGGCALYNGAGENYVRSFGARNNAVVLIQPAGGLSTACVYRAFDERPCFASSDVTETLLSAQTAYDIPLFNGLEQAANSLNSELAKIHAWVQEQPGVRHVMLTGSGSCTFVVCQNAACALTVAANAQAQGWWATSTFFANVRAAAAR